MSGSYDLLIFATGRICAVATFVSERLSSVEGVLSTATHFMLRAYKEQGIFCCHQTRASMFAVSAQ